MKIILLGIVLLTLVGIFLQRWNEISKDAESGPSNITFKEWLRLSAVEMLLNLGLFIALCTGVDINSLLKAADAVASGVGTYTDITSIAGAFATGSAIYKVVQFTLLPLWNLTTGARTARKKLRIKVESAVNKV